VRGLRNLLLKYLGRPYLYVARRIWVRIPTSLRHFPPVHWYGIHVHSLVRQLAERRQNHSTFFFRNRPELELIGRLVDQKSHGSRLDISVLGCSKGAEVYSIAWTIRSARPDLKLSLRAIDLSQEILDFAKEGVYSLKSHDVPNATGHDGVTEREKVTWNTCRDQSLSIFERMTEGEIKAMFDAEEDHAKVKSWLKEGITWHLGDAGDQELVRVLGLQDMVVANRFLCHMETVAAARCLRNIARLVKPGGYLLVSGIDLNVRTRVAREMGWRPVTDLIRETHEGDVSLVNDWPLEYWALEPFQAKRRDCMTRYASVFQLGVDACRRLSISSR
jgi:chemotaxis protein methyltransferase CheR